MVVDYDEAFYNSESLKYWAQAYAKVIPKDVQVLFSSGMSGCAIASAVLTLRDNLIHVSYRNTIQSHRGSTKKESGPSYRIRTNSVVAFIDDFVSSGETFKKSRAFFKEKYGNDFKYAILSDSEYKIPKKIKVIYAD